MVQWAGKYLCETLSYGLLLQITVLAKKCRKAILLYLLHSKTFQELGTCLPPPPNCCMFMQHLQPCRASINLCYWTHAMLAKCTSLLTVRCAFLLGAHFSFVKIYMFVLSTLYSAPTLKNSMQTCSNYLASYRSLWVPYICSPILYRI